MTRYRFAWWWFIGACLLALPASAQPGSEGEPIEVQVIEEEEEPPEIPPLEVERVEEPVEEEAEEPAGIASKLTAGAWCVLATREDVEVVAEGGEEVEGEQRIDQSIGCDGGVAAALLGKDFRQGRLSLVGVLGVRSLGAGISWTFGRQGGHPLSVAVGVVMPYSDQGIFADEASLAVGVTMAVFGRR